VTRSLIRSMMLGVGVAAVAAYSIASYGSGNVAGTQRQKTAAVSYGSQAAPPAPAIMALGRIEPLSRAVRIAAPSGGGSAGSSKISQLRVSEGAYVRAGAILATLDNEAAAAAALAQAEATVRQKASLLSKAIADLDNQEKSLLTALEQQEAERNRVRWDFEKIERLKKAGMYEDAALIDKRFALDASERRVEAARLSLVRVQTRDSAGIRIDEATARADLAVAEAAAAKARADHMQSFVVAPFAGVVLKIFTRPGEAIGSDGLLEFGDTSVMTVRAEVFESDIRFVREGDAVVAATRSVDGELRGKIERIGLRVGQQSIIKEDPAAVLDSRVVEVFVRLDDESSRRVQGLSNLQVRVSILRSETGRRNGSVGPVASSGAGDGRGQP
jgi:HlyD family secretion protein